MTDDELAWATGVPVHHRTGRWTAVDRPDLTRTPRRPGLSGHGVPGRAPMHRSHGGRYYRRPTASVDHPPMAPPDAGGDASRRRHGIDRRHRA